MKECPHESSFGTIIGYLGYRPPPRWQGRPGWRIALGLLCPPLPSVRMTPERQPSTDEESRLVDPICMGLTLITAAPRIADLYLPSGLGRAATWGTPMMLTRAFDREGESLAWYRFEWVMRPCRCRLRGYRLASREATSSLPTLGRIFHRSDHSHELRNRASAAEVGLLLSPPRCGIFDQAAGRRMRLHSVSVRRIDGLPRASFYDRLPRFHP